MSKIQSFVILILGSNGKLTQVLNENLLNIILFVRTIIVNKKLKLIFLGLPALSMINFKKAVIFKFSHRFMD